MKKALELLEKHYGYKNFKPGQLEIINNILRGRDSFCIMPTGGGKSICYQIPALILNGITLVISPLISLMKDQVDSLEEVGINAKYINSTQSMDEIKEIFKACQDGEVKLLYIAPERLESDYFTKMLKNLWISQIAIDEAHCVSMWGHDFRTSYTYIEPFINSLNIRPIVTTFTATATEAVKEDIIKLIKLKNPFMYIGSFDRENLEISVYKEEDKIEFVKDYIRENEEVSGIVYCLTRKEVDGLYTYLKERGMSVAKYHGGLKDSEKNYYQEEFLKDNFNVMIATNAFGMGIDKSNVRYIIHFTLPKNLESYYQEIGRGGRDGERTKCVLLYNREDIRSIEYLIYTTTKDARKEIEIKKLQSIIDFSEEDKCYRSFILNYFGEPNPKPYCNNCSNCLNNEELRDFTIETQMILSCVYRSREEYGISVLVDILRGFTGPKIIKNRLNQLTTFGIMKDYSSKFIRGLIKTLLELGYVSLKEGTYSMLKLNNKSVRVLKGQEKVICNLSQDIDEVINNEELYNALKVWRKQKANALKIKPYIIFSDTTLIDLSNKLPSNKEELLSIKGMGEKKFENYGEEILKIIKSADKVQVTTDN